MRKQALLIAALVLFAGCEVPRMTPSADDVQERETERMVADAHQQVGMPSIVNWTERRQMRDILELRDEPDLATFTYIVNMDGDLLPLCQSIGYGLPYSVQYTNPERELNGYQSITTIPQPDPNGLFMPNGLSATWVLCVDPQTGTADPVYVEPEIIVTRFELDFGGWAN